MRGLSKGKLKGKIKLPKVKGKVNFDRLKFLGSKKAVVKGSRFGKQLTAILMLSMLVPVLVVGSILFMRMSTYINDDVRQNNAVILNEVDTFIRSELDSVTGVLTILTKDDYVNRMQPFIVESMFKNIQSAYNLIVNINVVDNTGRIIYSNLGSTGSLSAGYLDRAFEGEVTYSNIAILGSGTDTRKIIKQAFPIVSEAGRARGAIVGEISLNAFEQMVSSLQLPEGVEVLILSQDGLLLAHSNAESFTKLSKQLFTDYTPFVNATYDVTSKNIDFNKTDYLASYSRIPGLEWTIAVQVPETVAFKELSTSRNLFIGILILAAVLGYFGSKVIAARSVKPLLKVSEAALVASGGDFTVSIDDDTLKRKDEFGDLGRAFMAMVESFRGIITHLADSTDVLDSTADDLVQTSEVSNTLFEQIIEQAHHLSKTANDDMEHAKRVVLNVNEMNEGSENVAQNTDQLNMLIKNNVEFSNQGVMKLNRTAELIAQTVSAYEKIENNIKGLEKSAVDIGGITDSIVQIANQTNLLALNAAIEAARAGEAGRGFAVVANEIRNLADQSNQSASNITSIIKEIQGDIKETSEVFGDTSKMLENVAIASSETVAQMNEVLADSQKAALAIDEISAVTEEHAATSAQINEMMESMLETLNDTSKTTVEMSELINVQKNKNEETVEKIVSIKDLSSQFKDITDAFKY